MNNRFANFLPLIFYQRSLVTPIHCPIKTNRISQQEFKILANEVIGHVFAIHARKQKVPPAYMMLAHTIADWGFHGQDNCGGCGGSTTPILEGSAVQLWAYLKTMGRPGDRVIFRADTNFNGTFELEETKTVDVANGQHFNFSFPVADDGVSSGDDEPAGTMKRKGPHSL